MTTESESRMRRDQTEFIGAALCALGVNRDESVAPGNQILAEIERLRGLLMEANAGIRALSNAYAPDGHSVPYDCFATGPSTGNPFQDLVVCPACVAHDLPAVRRALGEIGGEG